MGNLAALTATSTLVASCGTAEVPRSILMKLPMAAIAKHVTLRDLSEAPIFGPTPNTVVNLLLRIAVVQDKVFS
jgi:hypothetical protein